MFHDQSFYSLNRCAYEDTFAAFQIPADNIKKTLFATILSSVQLKYKCPLVETFVVLVYTHDCMQTCIPGLVLVP